MQAKYPEFQSQNAQVVAVSFGSPEQLATYLKHTPSPFPVLADPTRALYTALGLGRAPLWKLLHPKGVASFFRQVFRGKRVARPEQDIYQLGGDFVFNAQGKVVFSYPSRHPADRPSVEQLLQALVQ